MDYGTEGEVMNKEVIKKYIAEFNYWLNGGEVFAHTDMGWININDSKWNWEDDIPYVIKDKHFEARKAYALGEEIEYKCYNTNYKWEPIKDPQFIYEAEYRTKPKNKTIVLEEWLVTDGKDYWVVQESDREYSSKPTYVKKLSERTVEIEGE